MRLFTGRTANQLWAEAAKSVLTKGERQESRAGETLELLHCTLVLEDPFQRWVSWREPVLNPAFAISEVVWIVNGRRDAGFLNFWNPGLPRFAGEGNNYHGAYGYRLRSSFDIDQVERAYLALKNSDASRQVVLQIWDPRLDFPTGAGEPQAADIPCNICALLKLREGRLDWTQIMRSNDIVLGLPFNIIQFTSMQELMASWLGVKVGVYTHFSDSLHAYERNLEALERFIPGEECINSDRWNLGYAKTMEVFRDLAQRMDRLRDENLDQVSFERVADCTNMVEAGANFLRTAAADAARRRGWADLAAGCMKECSNPALRETWRRWCGRQENGGRTE